MSACITEIFTDCSTCKRRIILKRSWVSSCRGYNYSVIQGALLLESVDYRRNSRSLLTYRHINTIYRFTSQIRLTLIDDRINCDGCLSGLTITDDELTLTAADRNHRINRFQTCLQRFVHRLTEDHSRSLSFQRHLDKFSSYHTLAVKRFTKRIHHASDHGLAHINRRDPTGPAHGHSLLDLVCRT